jgi:hypothetical protein
MTSASDPKAVAKAKRKAEEAIEQQRLDLQGLLKLPEFRRYVWRLIGERCKFLESPGSSNGSVQSVNIGRQDVAREVWAEIELADPLAIPTMMRETFEANKQP